jgi:aminodeoxyfutalosine synthase
MLGKELMQMALLFGADDIDGTINDSTKIYSMAGADEHPILTIDELCSLVRAAGFLPVERDTLYKEL